MSKSDTPRTNANLWASINGCIKGQHGEPFEQCYVPAPVVAALEAELNAASKQRDELLKAGDKMLNAWLTPEDEMEYSEWVALSADATAGWYQARKAKP